MGYEPPIREDAEASTGAGLKIERTLRAFEGEADAGGTRVPAPAIIPNLVEITTK